MFWRSTFFSLLACTLIAASNGTIFHAKAEQSTSRNVTFASAVYPPTPFQIRRAKALGRKAPLTAGQRLVGRLTRPGGNGPFAAVVLMHGCHGIGAWNRIWSARLVSWGYAVLDVDGFGPRGHASVCVRPTVVAGPTRALDAHGAARFLSKQTFIDGNRIAVMGMSHGGWSTLNAINHETTERLRLPSFRAAVALYPWCEGPAILDAPLLIAAAARDDWTPAQKCRAFVKRVRTDHVLALKIYPEAHHMFDVPGLDKIQFNHVIRHDPKAEADVIERVRAFLAQHL